MKTIHQILFKGVVIDCHGYYNRGTFGTHETPPESESFDIDKVMLNGADITELVDDYINDLEIEIITEHYR